jgi:hypothetical protein
MEADMSNKHKHRHDDDDPAPAPKPAPAPADEDTAADDGMPVADKSDDGVEDDSPFST